jgi:hypothetical protein
MKYLLIILICIPNAFFGQLISQPEEFYDDGSVMRVKFLNEDLQVVKYQYKGSDGSLIAEYNYEPNSGLKHGKFFSGDNKGTFNMDVLTADNYTIIDGTEMFVIDKVVDGRIIGSMNCYTREEIYSSYYDANTSKFLSYANKQKMNFYRSVGTGEHKIEFKCVLHYNNDGNLDGKQVPNEYFNLYYEDGKLTGYVKKNENNSLAKDSIFREAKLWKYENQFFKNTGYAWLPVLNEFESPWELEVNAGYYKSKCFFFGSSNVPVTDGPEFYKRRGKLTTPLIYGARYEKRNNLNKHGIYTAPLEEPELYRQSCTFTSKIPILQRLDSVSDRFLLKKLNGLGVSLIYVPGDKEIYSKNKHHWKFVNIEKISESLTNDSPGMTEFFFLDALGNYINPFDTKTEFGKYISSNEYSEWKKKCEYYQDTMNKLFIESFDNDNQGGLPPKGKFDQYFDFIRKSLEEEIDVTDLFRYRGDLNYTGPKNKAIQYAKQGGYGMSQAYSNSRNYRHIVDFTDKETSAFYLTIIPNTDKIPRYMLSSIAQLWQDIRFILRQHVNGDLPDCSWNQMKTGKAYNIVELFLRQDLVEELRDNLKAKSRKITQEADYLFVSDDYNDLNKSISLYLEAQNNFFDIDTERKLQLVVNKKYDLLYHQGIDFWKQNQFNSAIEKLKEAYEVKPSDSLRMRCATYEGIYRSKNEVWAELFLMLEKANANDLMSVKIPSGTNSTNMGIPLLNFLNEMEKDKIYLNYGSLMNYLQEKTKPKEGWKRYFRFDEKNLSGINEKNAKENREKTQSGCQNIRSYIDQLDFIDVKKVALNGYGATYHFSVIKKPKEELFGYDIDFWKELFKEHKKGSSACIFYDFESWKIMFIPNVDENSLRKVQSANFKEGLPAELSSIGKLIRIE